MRTVLTRLAAIGVVTAALAGCTGGSTTPLGSSGGLNGTGGSNGVNTSNTNGGAPNSTTGGVKSAAVTIPAGGVVTFPPGTLGDQFTITFPAGISGTTPGTTATLSTQLTPFTGVPSAVPSGSFALEFGQLALSGTAASTFAFTASPTIQVVFPSGLIPGRGAPSIAFFNTNTGASTVVQGTLSGGNTVTFPSAALSGFAPGAPLTFVIYQ